MKIAGIIAEYNPFHYGHKYHLEKAKELTNADYIVVIMSGNFTQRGIPAITDKWSRANCAIENGCDLVIELPYIFATQSADGFAKGAIDILKNIGIDYLVFGSECGNIESLQEIADISYDVDRFKENMDAGYSYPKAYDFFAKSYGPNDILGISYLKQLKNTTIEPIVIKRTVNYFDDNINPISSASGIRKAVLNNQDISIATPMSDKINSYNDISTYYQIIRYLLLTLDQEYLKDIFLVNEGIENHLTNCARKCKDYQSFIEMATTRRYTTSRINRTLLQILTQTTKDAVDKLSNPSYIRVLSYNDKGQQLLKLLRKKGITIASKFVQIPKEYRDIEMKAAVAYSLPYPNKEANEIIQREIYGNHK